MFLAFLLLAAGQSAPVAAQDGGRPDAYRPAPATVVAEPVALFLAAADRDHDGRTTRAEMHQTLTQTTATDPAWTTGIGFIAYSDWAERWLGDRNGVPTPFDLDRNGDQKVTFAELSDRFDALFTRFDADRDGTVSRAELLTVRTTPYGRPDAERRGRRGGRRPAER
ncbi:MAG: EF-hand domain-containing protein [Sphingomonadales bacterium]|nr:EF-hand domain-containing protein [Sphingomonadales bacterium]